MKKIIILVIALSLNNLFLGCDLGKSKNKNPTNFNTTKKRIYSDDSLRSLNEMFNFDIELADTLVLGYNKGKILNYKKPKEKGALFLLSVIIENKYEVIKRDTFSNGTLSPRIL